MAISSQMVHGLLPLFLVTVLRASVTCKATLNDPARLLVDQSGEVKTDFSPGRRTRSCASDCVHAALS